MLKKLTALAALTATFLSAGAALADDPLTIGFIIPNAIGETGWDHEMKVASEAAQDYFGDKVEFQTVDSVGEGPDSTRVMNMMAAKGADMVFLGSFGHMNDGLKLAKQYPDLAVVHAGGYMNAPNFATYAVRHYEGAYLAGMASGYLTKNGQLGVIAAFPLPEVIGIMNAYVLGAQSVNPDLKEVKVIWLNAWYDPAKNRAAAESLISQGSDALFSLFPGTPTAVTAGEELGAYVAITVSDNSQFAPTRHTACIQINFTPVYVKKIQEKLDGAFKGDDTFMGIAEGAVSIAGLNPDLTKEQVDAIMAKQEEIKTGSFAPFSGPIFDNEGNEVVASGQSLDDKAIKSMDFVVRGVDAKLEN